MSRRIIIMLALGIALAATILFGVTQCQGARNAKTATGLAKGQTGAAIESGGDAVDTLGNRAAADAAGDQLTRENEDAIRKADGAAAPVAAPVRDAGIASLCRRSAYRSDPQCLQPPVAR